MTNAEFSGANAAQFEHWNGPGGEIWVTLQDRLDAQFIDLSQKAMDRAAPRPNEQVLDVGCGTGYTTLELARRVAPGGSALGVDISRPMLELARRRAASTSTGNVRFEQGDAQTHRLEPGGFDLVFSRFGVMFFADPVAAFANLRSALRRGGRLTFMCWRPVRDNPWVAVPMQAAFEHIPRPAPPPPGAPGEFSFADAKRVHEILAGAGFGDIVIEPVDEIIGRGSLDLTLDTTLRMGPVAAALREAAPEKKEAVSQAVREALAPFESPGGMRMGAAVWLAEAFNR